MINKRKSRALNIDYVSEGERCFPGFENPFERQLDPNNRWVLLAKTIPWDSICNIVIHRIKPSSLGRKGLNARIIIGSLIIKHLCDLSDEDTVLHISENLYMQYFLGFSSFISEKPFDSSLFVRFRKDLGLSTINQINEKIISLKMQMEGQNLVLKEDIPQKEVPKDEEDITKNTEKPKQLNQDNDGISNRGKVIFDATCCPQDIAYPTDLGLLNAAREKAEELIDFLYEPSLHNKKPRTYRKNARKNYLRTAQKKNKTKKEIRRANGKQLQYLRRDIQHINKLLDKYKQIPFDKYQYKYFLVIQTLYDQQIEMHRSHKHTIDDRIVSIHQPHVRPIVRGKQTAKVEFGAKINASIVDGITFIDQLDWNAFNESVFLVEQVENYKKRFGFYPAEVFADQIYCTRANRTELKRLNIKLKAKPLGRPSLSASSIRVSPGERNPIEGKFGQAKTRYGLGRIKARLQNTSEAWIAGIFMVLNLVKLAGLVSYALIQRFLLILLYRLYDFLKCFRRRYMIFDCEKIVLT